jgi:TonB family protein
MSVQLDYDAIRAKLLAVKRLLLAGLLANRLTIAILVLGFAGLPVYAQTPSQSLPNSVSVPASIGKQGSSVEILSPTEGVDFGSYIANLTFKVREVWYADMPKDVYLGAKGRCSVTFRISAGGKIDQVSLESSSGMASLDEAAMKSLRDTDPMDPLPAQFKAPYMQLRFTYLYNLGSKGATTEADFDCKHSDGEQKPAEEWRFDRLEIVAFLSNSRSYKYTMQEICQRGINFTPDAGLLDGLLLDAVPAGVIGTVAKIKPQTIVEPAPDRIAANVELDAAIVATHKKQYTSADESYLRALKLAPDSAALHFAYADNLLSGRKFPEAEIEARKSLALWPGNSNAHAFLAIALSSQNRPIEAEAEAREALRIFPDNAAAVMVLGANLIRSGDYKEAIPYLREAIAASPQIALLHKGLGAALVHTGSFEDGARELTLFLKTNPDDADAHYLLGVALRGTGKTEDAGAQFREAARLAPASPIFAAAADPNESNKGAPDEPGHAKPGPDDGFTAGNSYTNTFFNFSYDYPRGWTAQRASRGEVLLRYGGTLLANSDPTASDTVEAGVRNSHTLLLVTRTEQKDLTTTVDLIQITAMKIESGRGFGSGGDFLKQVDDGLHHANPNFSVVEAAGQSTFGDGSIWKARADFLLNGVVRHEVQFATIQKGYVIVFAFASLDKAKADEIAATMQSLRFGNASR